MHILLIAPSAPPKNSSEAIQAGRFLSALDPSTHVTLVTTPVASGWQWNDTTLNVIRPGMDVISVSMPVHRIAQRVLANHRLAALHVPDADFWLPWFARQVTKQLQNQPDVIYSRSAPFSSALLAHSLKHRLRIPWLMHLSDPWHGNPYRKFRSKRHSTRDLKMEAACFKGADAITLTTEGQADFYRERYAAFRKSIAVSPNMMPASKEESINRAPPDKSHLKLVYAGALYGQREPSTLISALHLLRKQWPETASRIEVEFYGNVVPEIAAQIGQAPGCVWRGVVSSDTVSSVQSAADVLVTIEPPCSHPLHLHFMPGKNLDYIAHGKPIIAITPKGSETERLCSAGYGWAVIPGDARSLADRLHSLVETQTASHAPLFAAAPLPSEYFPENVTASIVAIFRTIMNSTKVSKHQVT